jgi:Right handed beta helix region
MKKVSFVFILSMAIAAFANAQATRTWVSGVGDDVNPCSRTAPCKTFAGAISKTASPGIINCLDPGGFGAVTITKSITIDCTATLGSALSSGTQGIIVNAQPTDKIVLRNLDINGAGVTLGTNGVNVVQAQSVHLFNVRIANYSGSGIQVTNTSGAVALFVDDCQILNNGGNGILMNPTSPGTSKLNVGNSWISNNVNGIDISSGGNSAVISHTIIDKNSAAGFQVENTNSGASLDGVTIAHNAIGVQAGIAGQTPTLFLTHCFVWGNTSNGITGSGTTRCYSNNVIDGNTVGNACSVPNQPQQ